MPPHNSYLLCSRLRCWHCEFDAKKLSVCQKCLSMEKWHKLIEEWNEEICQVSNLFDVVHFPSRVGESQHGVKEHQGQKKRNMEKTEDHGGQISWKHINKYFTKKWTLCSFLTHMAFSFSQLKTKGDFFNSLIISIPSITINSDQSF